MARGLVGILIGMLVAAIVGLQVFIPIVNDGIASANLTGTTATVLGLLPMFIGLLLLVAMAGPLMGALGR